MGNCLKLRPARTWVDDEEWDFADGSKSMKQYHCKEEKKKGERMTMTEEKREEASCNKVKIKLTKKQLQELSELLEMHGLQIEEALAKFIDQKNSTIISRELGSQIRPWRPVLQGIPEE
ncbi:Bacteriocin AS-48-containing protein [Dioscorea alata]|uniref:Bacteriocin AS-48-containing protein n=1 Tax=Dioscorea alata TaxID=55571 RepID=A0ACB7TUC5_DIOAL|nr:Bacteriocin AS-48-containing protein [Dioscorea alata]